MGKELWFTGVVVCYAVSVSAHETTRLILLTAQDADWSKAISTFAAYATGRRPDQQLGNVVIPGITTTDNTKVSR
ncbi:hypothetical protein [Klebsiella pneumoniae IS43]|uniref:Uncharacterized protein n=1 Tax=Klebsiella pneumoniae IS43 TaxID=1432552 RepID=W1DH62_KLEPN|nr:hypothetical protein [Klebsiella pneumoniae IS43]